MVAERTVLRRIEHLEHRARGIAAHVGAHLVDLVDQQDRIHGFRVAQGADDRAGHCTDVRPAMAADLRLVTHAAHREARELPPERAGDRLPERGLADSGRADEAEDLPGRILLELRDGEVLDDSLLHLVEVVVVLVEDLARPVEIEVVGRRHAPRQRREPVEVRADHAVLRSGRRKALEACQLAVGGLPYVVGKVECVEPLPQLVRVGLLGIALAELLLDRLQLLPEEELALSFLELRLHLRLDLRSELEDLELPIEDLGDLAQTLLGFGELEDQLLLLGLEAEGRRDEVAETARVVYVRSRDLELLGQVRREADNAAEQALRVPQQCLELAALGRLVRYDRKARKEVRLGRRSTPRFGSGAGPERGSAACRRGRGSSCARPQPSRSRTGRPSRAPRSPRRAP